MELISVVGRVFLGLANNQTLTHLLGSVLQLINPKYNEHRQVEGEQAGAHEQSHRPRHVHFSSQRAALSVSVFATVYYHPDYYVLEVEQEADRVREDEHQVLVEGLLTKHVLALTTSRPAALSAALWSLETPFPAPANPLSPCSPQANSLSC